MSLPVLNTATPASVALQLYYGLDGRPLVITLIKQRFTLRANGQTERVPDAPIHFVDVPWDEDSDEPMTTRYPAEGGLAKRGTDVVVVGSAIRAGGGEARSIDVRVRVGPVEKHLRVFGPRVWTRAGRGARLSDPVPFEALPLRWEEAYGGVCEEDPDAPVFEQRNPIGRGAASHPSALVGQLAPRIEDPRDLIRDASSRPSPAGVAAIGSHFQPRVDFAGTFDQAWQDERMPLLPLDFDERHNQVATPELICPSFLRGGEPVALEGLHPRGPLQFRLPKIVFGVVSQGIDGTADHRAALDTVLIEPMASTLDLTWRAVVPSASGRRAVRSIRVFEKQMR